MSAEITSKKTTKISIPHPDDEVRCISGVLEQLSPDEPTKGRRIALILHGTMGHKDYLFQKRLALRLPIDSFRFDFRGNHETPGTWRLGDIDEDVQDIRVVAAYLTKRLGYVVDAVVGHSRGSVAGMLWVCWYADSDARTVRAYVNASGRYRMFKMYDQMRRPDNQAQLEKQGFYEINATVARKPFVGRVTEDDHHKFAAIDSSVVWDRFPAHVDVFTMHGMKDTVVPTYDAIIYARALGARSPGTHSLCLEEDADHNFTGMADHVVDTILEWWGMFERRELKTGIWHTGVRPKL
ncbi:ectomycorrhiza-regulated esterase [Wolfiporia cocos MD-104 SS10]|uniref:Ectomycorrhiza-regulated esterase n=1 Tax=Wolfiporia cocos (strain MD-104) TaxID=742152 RepID=A0A2H3JQW0_WOLCO|nr:ectomycorrhiza-regulated esterase [Wolfiporia cocos MD-104 SS10]